MSQNSLSPVKYIEVYGACEHNLKNIDVRIPKNQLTVITGLSGSGKSSLAFATLFAEGQRRFVESMSAYLRQYLGKLQKPKVDKITGLCPAIAISQKLSTSNSRSTVGTLTEIDDYLRLLFAKIGLTISPSSGKIVQRHTVADVLQALWENTSAQDKFYVLSPLNASNKAALLAQLTQLSAAGFTRILHNDQIIEIEDCIAQKELTFAPNNSLYLLIDRCVASQDAENTTRISASAQTAFDQSEGLCTLAILPSNSSTRNALHFLHFSHRFEEIHALIDGKGRVVESFIEPSEAFFSFNSPLGACPHCEASGIVYDVTPRLVFLHQSRSVAEGVVRLWQDFPEHLVHFKKENPDFPFDTPYCLLPENAQQQLWKAVQASITKDKNIKKKELKIYQGATVCTECQGTRLRKETNYVQVGGKNFGQLQQMPLNEVFAFFEQLQLSTKHAEIAAPVLREIHNRLQYLMQVGLPYLTLNRTSGTLSGGESQRIHLASSLGNALVGSLYVLDEPSVGLHSTDTAKLLQVLRALQGLGNTVVLVEHDPEIIRTADYLIDLGPKAGNLGGEVVFQGSMRSFLQELPQESLTAAYLKDDIPSSPKQARAFNAQISLQKVYAQNLQLIDVTIPLGVFTVVTGPSGSGKSSLVKEVLYPLLEVPTRAENPEEVAIPCQKAMGIPSDIQVVWVDQNPISRSSRSSPVLYIGAYEGIRSVYAKQAKEQHKDFTASHFSFNSKAKDGIGRCEACEGEGYLTIEMQFLADVKLLCETCKGKRFTDAILTIDYKGKNIYDVLCLTIDQAVDFFQSEKTIVHKLQMLQKVGLGYLTLGQASNTLSGGEAQRVKLAYFLLEDQSAKTTASATKFFIFDEPTSGLHSHDVTVLLRCFDELLAHGHTVLVIEHNLQVITQADWVIELGPKGGKEGGRLLFQGQGASTSVLATNS